jgi:hypothetical protein
LGESGPSTVLSDDNDFDAPEGPFYDEREAMEEIIAEDALNSDSDDSDWEDESGEVVGDATAKRKFDSQLETLLWFNTAGPKNTSLPKRSRETWLQLMKDEGIGCRRCSMLGTLRAIWKSACERRRLAR